MMFGFVAGAVVMLVGIVIGAAITRVPSTKVQNTYSSSEIGE